MAEELVMDAPQTKTVFDGFSDVVIPDKPLEDKKEEIVVDKTPIVEDKKEEKPVDVPKEDGRSFLKAKLGYEDWDSAKNEIELLKQKAQTPAEIKYANEQSKKLAEAWIGGKTDDVYNYLDAQIKLNKLTSGEVTEENAPDIIKAHYKEKYKGLTNDQVNYKFNKQFSIPKAPVQSDTEDEEEYKSKKSDWQKQVDDIKMDILIEANLARPELEKLKTELILPEIAKVENTEKEPSPEDQARSLEVAKQFLQNAQAEVNKFEGFTIDYKDKDVNIKSTYTLSDEEKANVLGKMQVLAEKNYNSNAVFAERWVNDDNTFNFNQMAKDLAILETYDKAGQKFVGDTTAQAKKQFIKEKHNIDLTANPGSGDIELVDKDTQKKNEDTIWGLN